jgi:hypothetical protein
MQRSQKPATFFEKLMAQPAPKDCMPPSTQQVNFYHEYMSEVTSALRLAPPAAKQRLEELDGKAKSICETIRQSIPSADRVNDTRVEIVAVRKDLLQALQAR